MSEQINTLAVRGETAIETAIEPKSESVLFAVDRAQMLQAQEKMRVWLQTKIRIERQRIKELAENLEIATRNKWRVSLLRNQLATGKRKVIFFSKFLVAIEAGYQPIPDLWMGIFAIRTRRSRPVPRYAETTSFGKPRIDNEESQRLPPGEGEYRNPSQLVKRGQYKDTREGKEVDIRWVQTSEFQEVIDLPFILVKPELLNETQRALALKIFDEVGVIIPRSGRRDPIIAGRIRSWTTYGRDLLFLIGWYMDMREFDN